MRDIILKGMAMLTFLMPIIIVIVSFALWGAYVGYFVMLCVIAVILSIYFWNNYDGGVDSKK